MSDIIDKATDSYEILRQKLEDNTRNKIYSIVKGEPGICEECGLHFKRLVNGFCGKCRDELNLN